MVGLRSLLVDIYPASLTSAGLSAALHDLTGTMSGRGVQLTVAVAPGLDDRLDQDSREAIFRVAQEALRNAVRHAAATAVTISVDIVAAEPAGHPLHRDIARLIVADDGLGMPGTAAAPADREDHFGMRLMTDIAVRTHSTLALRSAPGAGTELRMDVTLA
jgi:signal transduction histidine kinase